MGTSNVSDVELAVPTKLRNTAACVYTVPPVKRKNIWPARIYTCIYSQTIIAKVLLAM
jgi:hypothetical protein